MSNGRLWRTALGVGGLAGAAAAASLAAASAATAPSRVYGGVTAQHWPIVIELSKDGRSVARARVGIGLTCTSGKQIADYDAYKQMPLDRAGRFRSQFGPQPPARPTATPEPVPLQPPPGPAGSATTFSGSLAGRLRAGRITGTWRYRRIELDASGNVIDNCDSGTVRFLAHQ